MRVVVPTSRRDQLKTVFPGHMDVVELDTVFYLMQIQINGEKKTVAASLSVAQLLQDLAIRPGRVVVEVNRQIVSREAHCDIILKDGDAVEIVQFVGGG